MKADNPTFAVKFRQGDEGWRVERYLHGWMEIFDYSPDVACWFREHPHATYFQSDHGEGLHWRYEILKAEG